VSGLARGHGNAVNPAGEHRPGELPSAPERQAAPAPDAEVVDPDYPVTPVPPHARTSFFSIAVVLLGFTVFTPTMLAGATLGPAFGATAACTRCRWSPPR
jgi:hypothetical protein